MPKLHFHHPDFAPLSCELPEGTTTVGRSSRNRIVLNDPSVSGDHGDLLVSWNEVIVRDHGSSNGTWVAGVRVNGQRPANHGDVIRFGRVEARVELDEFPAGDATSITANFGVSRESKPGPDPDSMHVVVGSRSRGEDTHTSATSSVPPPAGRAMVEPDPTGQPTPPESVRQRGSAGRNWGIGLLVLAALAAAVWIVQRLR